MSTRLNDIAGDLEARAWEIEHEHPDLTHVPLELHVAAQRIRNYDRGTDGGDAWMENATRLIAALQCAVTDYKVSRREHHEYIGQNTRDAALAVLEKYESTSMSDEELLKQPDYLLARGVTMHIAFANMRGLEVAVFEDEGDVKPHRDVATEVYLFTMTRPARRDFKGNDVPPDSTDFRVIVRHFRHVAIQYKVGDRWESPTFFSLEMTADAILAMMFQRMVPLDMQQAPTLDESQRVMTYQMPPWNFL